MSEVICPICGLKFTRPINFMDDKCCPRHADGVWRKKYTELQAERDLLRAQLDKAMKAMKLARYDERINTHASLIRPILEDTLAEIAKLEKK